MLRASSSNKILQDRRQLFLIVVIVAILKCKSFLFSLNWPVGRFSLKVAMSTCYAIKYIFVNVLLLLFTKIQIMYYKKIPHIKIMKGKWFKN